MILSENLISSMKADSFDEALSNALPIFDLKKKKLENWYRLEIGF